MIRLSRVSLLIQCTALEVAEITSHLGMEPSEVVESRPRVRQPDGKMAEEVWHTWTLHSPISSDEHGPIPRLWALADFIEPFGDRLLSLDQRWKRWIDILYHVTPQRANSIAGEFNWFHLRM